MGEALCLEEEMTLGAQVQTMTSRARQSSEPAWYFTAGIWLWDSSAARIASAILIALLPFSLTLLWIELPPIVRAVGTVGFVLSILSVAWGESAGRKKTGDASSELTDMRKHVLALTHDLQEASGARNQLEADNEVAELAVHAAIRKTLGQLAREKGLGPRDRVTLFRVHSGALRVVSRHSKDIELAKIGAQTRAQSLDTKHGLVGYVHQTGRAISVPSGPSAEPYMNYRRWQSKECFLNPQKAASLRMRSRHYEIVPIHNDEDVVVGVIALESLDERCDVIVDLAVELGRTNFHHTVVLREKITFLSMLLSDQ